MPEATGHAKTYSAARKRWTRLFISLIVLLVFMLHSLGIVSLGVLNQVENFLYDARVRMTMPNIVDGHAANRHIVIVDIDERTLAVEGQWPLPRDKLARLLDQLFDHYGVSAVGFDIVYAEEDKSTALIKTLESELRQGSAEQNSAAQRQLEQLLEQRQPDKIFANALSKRNIVLGYYFKYESREGEQAVTGVLPEPVMVSGRLNASGLIQPAGFTGNLPEFQKAAATGGYFDNPLIDGDGSMRRVPLLQYYNGQFYESLALALTRAALHKSDAGIEVAEDRSKRNNRMSFGGVTVRTAPDSSVLVPFHGYMGAFPYVSATDVINGKASIDTLFDAIVIVGTTAPGLMDLRTTPVGHVYPGVEVHANVIAGLLDNSFKHEPAHPRLVETGMLVSIGLALALLLPMLSAFGGILLVVFLIVGSMVVNLVLWLAASLVLPMASPILYSIVVILLQMTYSFLVESRSRRRLSQQFGQYVPREIVEEMAQSEQEISLQGSSREMTVLFSDVIGFTKIAESMEPSQLTELMNAFLTPITSTIHQHRGTVDKYMGDAVMAFWGAPLADPDHAQHALLAAMDMVKSMKSLWPAFAERGWPRIDIGIGMNTGVMHVGNMGSEFRVAYTVLGDAVNLGSRLEALTRQYGVDIVVSEFTVSQIKDFVFRELDRVRVKGRDTPVTIYEPIAPAGSLSSETAEELSRYEQALGFYRLQNWDGTERAFSLLQKSFPERALYRVYLERISYFQRHPPEPGWDGVFRYEVK